MQTCPDLERVTTEYVATEDRIRLSGATADDQTVVLWLTRRLLDLLAPRLTEWLERRDATEVMDSELVQGFAQEAAEASLAAQPAVQAASPAGAWLIETVDIHVGADGVMLTFKTDEGAVANLTLPAQALRQWLGIVRGQYGVGGWPRDIWPAWMGETHALTTKPSTTALH